MDNKPLVAKLDPLTSLRFFAAAMIVIGHSHHLFGSLGLATTFSLSQGVSFFFVLSGFILAYNYNSLPDGKFAARFLISRFARIWPLHIATLSIWLAVITPVITHEFSNPASATVKLVLNALLLQSWAFVAPYILSFNGVAWSISTEAFFYTTFAVIALSPARRLPTALALTAIVVVAFISIATVAGLKPDDGAPGVTMFGILYTNPLVRLLEFLFGIVCARLYRSHGAKLSTLTSASWLPLELAAIGMIALALYLVASPTAVNSLAGAGAAYYVYKEGIWLLWGLLILVFALSRGPIARFLSIRPMVFLGEISFALYLVHAIILNIADRHAESLQSMGSTGVALFWAACILASSALHIAIENPFRKMIINWWDGKATQRNRPLFKTPQYASLVFLFCGSIFASTYQPSTVRGIDPHSITAANIPAYQYSNGISLINAEISQDQDGTSNIKLYFQLTKDASLDRHIGIHLNDQDGKIISVIGNVTIDQSSIVHQKGFSWMSSVRVKTQDFQMAKSIGVATFQDVNTLDEVTSGPSDWDGRRLILKLPL